MKPRSFVLGCLLVALVAGGCAKVPTTGAVRSGPGAGEQVGNSQFGLQAQPPRPGAKPMSIVNDFLDAMAASSGTDIAKQYLTPEAAARWTPDAKVTVFDRSDRKSIQENAKLSGATEVVLNAPEIATLDFRGAWTGAAPGKKTTFTFQLVRVNGELRISQAPQGRLIDQDLFESGYEQRNLYFFTPKMDALVPDAVYLPKRAADGQTATALSQALMAGPTVRLGDAVLSAAPEGTEVVSATVDADGVATVALNDKPAALIPDQRFKLAAQLAWTLRGQAPSVLKLKLTAGGQPLEVDGTTSELPLNRWDSYDAAFASQTGRQLYLLNDGEVRQVANIDAATQQEPQATKVTGLAAYGKESIAVDLDGQTLAAVSADGESVVVGPLVAAAGQPNPAVVSTSGKVLRPSFDKDHNLWIVDQADSGDPRIRVRREDKSLRDVQVNGGLKDLEVTAFRVARDGVRVLVVVRSKNTSRLMVGRINGTTVAHLQTMQLACSDIADAAWSRPAKIVALCGSASSRGYQPLEVNVDGSEPAPILANGVADFSPLELASAPDADALLAVRNDNGKVLVRQRDLTWTTLPRQGDPVYPG